MLMHSLGDNFEGLFLMYLHTFGPYIFSFSQHYL